MKSITEYKITNIMISKYIVTYFSIYESINSLCIVQYIVIYLQIILYIF